MTIQISRKSPFTGETHTMDIPLTQEEYDAGAAKSWSLNPGVGTQHIQDCFPQLNADHREFLATGITPQEWKEMFGTDEDES